MGLILLLLRFIDLFNKYAKDGEKELKLKRPAQMKEVLEMTRELILEKENKGESDNVEKLKVLKSVLEMLVSCQEATEVLICGVYCFMDYLKRIVVMVTRCHGNLLSW